ncbi:MAG: hypothetical protein JSU90_12965 [Nitrospiraceae bacterium]|nr:MAG: hypothetical protein JSU90_12965 [Nitrospiraceae bacterium]
MNNLKFHISYLTSLMPLLMLLLIAAGCQKVDKPVRGEEGSSPMAIVIEVDEAPESHTSNTTFEGERLVNPYSSVPVVGSLFRSSLKGIEFWKAHHPNLVTGLHNPALKADTEETCLDCHDQSTSCNNCHSYVGVGMVSAD